MIDLSSLRFAQPDLLWVLALPGALALLWSWRALQRRRDLRRLRQGRILPVRERPGWGDLPFWLGLLAALALLVIALAGPQGVTRVVRSPGADIVLLVDGSASMRVRDVGGDRWQRTMAWVRTLVQALSWDGDRLALASFAHIAVPQIRLTRDPNTVLFFLDYLERQPTFNLDSDATWDTNVEDAIYWGIKLVDADREAHGPNRNAKSFVLVSDGQVWSGDVDRALREALRRGIVVDVVGVGTSAGGFIPLPRDADGQVLQGFTPSRSAIDRPSLLAIARAGGGSYFEIGAASDAQIAARIVEAAARRSGADREGESFSDLSHLAGLAAVACLALGSLFIRERTRLALQCLVALGVMLLLARLPG